VKNLIEAELKKLYKYDTLKSKTRYHKKNYIEGENDLFAGIDVPSLRSLALKYKDKVPKEELKKLLKHKVHEHRLLGLLILTYKMKKADIIEQKEIVDLYIEHLDYINNWDLVDLSAHYILGKYFYNIQDYSFLFKLSLSENLWYKRISIVSTLILIRYNKLSVTLDLVDNLIKDEHDLIHKACGWMLRELGKKDIDLLTRYLKDNYVLMPRTMLRYAIEKYPKEIRQRILKGDFLWL